MAFPVRMSARRPGRRCLSWEGYFFYGAIGHDCKGAPMSIQQIWIIKVKLDMGGLCWAKISSVHTL